MHQLRCQNPRRRNRSSLCHRLCRLRMNRGDGPQRRPGWWVRFLPVAFCLKPYGALTMSGTHNCRMCGGTRPHNGEICLGCATPLAACKPVPVRRDGNICPKCTHHGPHKDIEALRVRCLKCGAVFEGPDFGFVDDRPHVNFEKLERLRR